MSLLILIPFLAFRTLGELVGEQNLVRVFLYPAILPAHKYLILIILRGISSASGVFSDLGKCYERLGIVMFDIRIDTGRHSVWRIAAPCFAKTSPQRGVPGRSTAWCRPGRNNCCARARLTYRCRKEFIRYAEHPSHADSPPI